MTPRRCNWIWYGLLFLCWVLCVTFGSNGCGTPAEGGEPPPPEPTFMYNLEPFVVNLHSEGGAKYLKTILSLEMDGTVDGEFVKKHRAKIRDGMIIVLSDLPADALGTMEAKELLRKRILRRMRRILGEDKVHGVYFTDFIISSV